MKPLEQNRINDKSSTQKSDALKLKIRFIYPKTYIAVKTRDIDSALRCFQKKLSDLGFNNSKLQRQKISKNQFPIRPQYIVYAPN